MLAPVSSFTIPINNLVGGMDALQTQNLRGRNAGNPAGVAAWNEWYNGPVGSALRNTFRFRDGSLINGQPDIISENRAGEVVATADVVSTGEVLPNADPAITRARQPASSTVGRIAASKC